MSPENITAIANLISALSWPLVVLILLFAFRKIILGWLKIPSSNQQRTIKAKAGSFELELSTIEDLQEKAIKIAEEPDPKKRLELAKNLIKLESILPNVNDTDIDVLVDLQKASIKSAKLADAWKLGEKDPALWAAYVRLEKMGLVLLENYYEGQCVALLTSLGEALLHSLKNEESRNK
jgi:hypothetical protein